MSLILISYLATGLVGHAETEIFRCMGDWRPESIPLGMFVVGERTIGVEGVRTRPWLAEDIMLVFFRFIQLSVNEFARNSKIIQIKQREKSSINDS